MNKTYPDSVVVDENDKVMGHMQMPEAYKQGKILRVSVVVVESNGKLLLQKRGPNVIAPNKWANTASGHVDWGDSYEDTARKELKEEMGVEAVSLKEFHYQLVEVDEGRGLFRRFTKYFLAEINDEPHVDGEEVVELAWLPLEQIEAELISTPDKYVTNFDESIAHIKKYLG